jgi:hypothetical protein
LGCFALALVAIVGAVLLFSTGFAGPAPIVLAGAGGLIAAGAALWRPPRNGYRGHYPVE